MTACLQNGKTAKAVMLTYRPRIPWRTVVVCETVGKVCSGGQAFKVEKLENEC